MRESVHKKRIPAEWGTPAAGPLNRAKACSKKDAARQIGGYGNKSYTLKGEPGTVGHLPTYRREVIPYQVRGWGRVGSCRAPLSH